MRKIIVLTAALCVAAVCLGQEATGYKSFFGQESTVWSVKTGYWDWNESNLLRLANDTLIGGLTFKKIERSHAYYWYNDYREWRDSTGDFYLREDTMTGRLWCHLRNGDSAFLIADMSLSIGDSIVLRDYIRNFGNYESVVYVVRDTMTQDSLYTIVLESGNRTVTFIEGVGCSNFFDFQSRVEDDIIGSELICCHKDSELVYHVEYWPEEDCIEHRADIEQAKGSQTISVWPNPSTDWFEIGCDNNLSAKLYDIKGNVIIDNIEANKRIAVSSIPRGIYLLCLGNENVPTIKTIILQ